MENTVGTIFNKARQDRGWTLTQVAAYSQVSQRFITWLSQGNLSSPCGAGLCLADQDARFIRVAKVLGLDEEYFVQAALKEQCACRTQVVVEAMVRRFWRDRETGNRSADRVLHDHAAFFRSLLERVWCMWNGPSSMANYCDLREEIGSVMGRACLEIGCRALVMIIRRTGFLSEREMMQLEWVFVFLAAS